MHTLREVNNVDVYLLRILASVARTVWEQLDLLVRHELTVCTLVAVLCHGSLGP